MFTIYYIYYITQDFANIHGIFNMGMTGNTSSGNSNGLASSSLPRREQVTKEMIIIDGNLYLPNRIWYGQFYACYNTMTIPLQLCHETLWRGLGDENWSFRTWVPCSIPGMYHMSPFFDYCNCYNGMTEWRVLNCSTAEANSWDVWLLHAVAHWQFLGPSNTLGQDGTLRWFKSLLWYSWPIYRWFTY